MAREINLVPDVKGEMIKALKLRNFIFFLCIVISLGSIAVAAIFGLTAGGQKLAIDSKNDTIKILSDKLNSYTDLKDFLTIKNQLSALSELSNRKIIFSRTFDILYAMKPRGADTVTISGLDVNFEEDNPTLTLEAQANAGEEPFIDYNVLDAFKKSMQYLRYDHGNYVDKDGNEIPAYCMIEEASDGTTLNDSTNGNYAYWTIEADGCKPESSSDDSATPEESTTSTSYVTEEYEGKKVVRIWRTPQFNTWYKDNKMSLDGAITGIEHFESACITYNGEAATDGDNPKWSYSNECYLVPGGTEGIQITESSNGREESGELVLRFSATITIDPEVYAFSSKHLLALAPSERYNVTDSYVQIQSMFSKRAKDCDKNDTDCNNANKGGN